MDDAVASSRKHVGDIQIHPAIAIEVAPGTRHPERLVFDSRAAGDVRELALIIPKQIIAAVIVGDVQVQVAVVVEVFPGRRETATSRLGLQASCLSRIVEFPVSFVPQQHVASPVSCVVKRNGCRQDLVFSAIWRDRRRQRYRGRRRDRSPPRRGCMRRAQSRVSHAKQTFPGRRSPSAPTPPSCRTPSPDRHRRPGRSTARHASVRASPLRQRRKRPLPYRRARAEKDGSAGCCFDKRKCRPIRRHSRRPRHNLACPRNPPAATGCSNSPASRQIVAGNLRCLQRQPRCNPKTSCRVDSSTQLLRSPEPRWTSNEVPRFQRVETNACANGHGLRDCRRLLF